MGGPDRRERGLGLPRAQRPRGPWRAVSSAGRPWAPLPGIPRIAPRDGAAEGPGPRDAGLGRGGVRLSEEEPRRERGPPRPLTRRRRLLRLAGPAAAQKELRLRVPVRDLPAPPAPRARRLALGAFVSSAVEWGRAAADGPRAGSAGTQRTRARPPRESLPAPPGVAASRPRGPQGAAGLPALPGPERRREGHLPSPASAGLRSPRRDPPLRGAGGARPAGRAEPGGVNAPPSP